jgi:Rrf2 family protein
MFKLHRRVEYALIALKHMRNKRPGELTTAKEIAETYGCSFDTTARVMQILAQKGLLHSTQGATGGYLILKDLVKVSFYDLSLALLGPIKLVKCLSTASCKMEAHCNIVSPMHILNQHLIDLYKKLSLHELLDGSQVANHLRLSKKSQIENAGVNL